MLINILFLHYWKLVKVVLCKGIDYVEFGFQGYVPRVTACLVSSVTGEKTAKKV
jgi:hypothetical protein